MTPRHPTRPFGPDDDRQPTPQPQPIDAATARLISRDEIGEHAKDCPMTCIKQALAFLAALAKE